METQRRNWYRQSPTASKTESKQNHPESSFVPLSPSDSGRRRRRCRDRVSKITRHFPLSKIIHRNRIEKCRGLFRRRDAGGERKTGKFELAGERDGEFIPTATDKERVSGGEGEERGRDWGRKGVSGRGEGRGRPAGIESKSQSSDSTEIIWAIWLSLLFPCRSRPINHSRHL